MIAKNDSCSFSIIVPVYNAEAFLRKAIDSVLKQTFTDYELILVNDGSTDSSLFLCQEFKQAFPEHVVVIDQNNAGPFEARKSGIRISRGKYILFLDSDDMLRSDTLEILYREIDRAEVDLLAFRGCRNDSFEWDSFSEEFRLFSSDEQNTLQSARDMLVSRDVSNNICLRCVKRDCLNGYVTGKEKRLLMAEDKLASAYILDEARALRQIDNVLYFYRSNTNSTMNKGYDRQCFDDLCEVAKELISIARGWNLPGAKYKIESWLLWHTCREASMLFSSKMSGVQRTSEAEHMRQNKMLNCALSGDAINEMKIHKRILLKVLIGSPALLRAYMPLYLKVTHFTP